MRIVFLGSPEPVLAPLKALLSAQNGVAPGLVPDIQVVGVVSQPARPLGRSSTPVDPPVAAFAKRLGIPTLQPHKASDPEFLAAFAALAPDVAITAAYGQILSKEFLKLPRRATINIHPSLLPRHRGATPVPAALLDGETVSGVTVLFTVEKLDAGNIIVQESAAIGANETAGELTNRYFAMSGPLVIKALAQLRDQNFIGTVQDERRVTVCRKIHKADGGIDWEGTRDEVYNRFRAFEPWPGSFTFHGERRLSVIEMRLGDDGMSALAPGAVTYEKRHRALIVGTGEGSVHILRLKPAGGKIVMAEAYWNGLKERHNVYFTADLAGTEDKSK